MSKLRAGDWVQVRSKEEILRTLDGTGRLGAGPRDTRSDNRRRQAAPFVGVIASPLPLIFAVEPDESTRSKRQIQTSPNCPKFLMI